jgi:hypothetical protein
MDPRAFQEHAQALLDSGSHADALIRLREVVGHGGERSSAPSRTLRCHQFVLAQSGFFAGLLRGAADAGRWAAPRRRGARGKALVDARESREEEEEAAAVAAVRHHPTGGGGAPAPVVFDIATTPAITADAVEACVR